MQIINVSTSQRGVQIVVACHPSQQMTDREHINVLDPNWLVWQRCANVIMAEYARAAHDGDVYNLVFIDVQITSTGTFFQYSFLREQSQVVPMPFRTGKHAATRRAEDILLCHGLSEETCKS